MSINYSTSSHCCASQAEGLAIIRIPGIVQKPRRFTKNTRRSLKAEYCLLSIDAVVANDHTSSLTKVALPGTYYKIVSTENNLVFLYATHSDVSMDSGQLLLDVIVLGLCFVVEVNTFYVRELCANDAYPGVIVYDCLFALH